MWKVLTKVLSEFEIKFILRIWVKTAVDVGEQSKALNVWKHPYCASEHPTLLG